MLPTELQKEMAAIGEYDSKHVEIIDELLARLDAALPRDRQLWDGCRCGQRCWQHARAKPERMRYRAPYLGPRYLARRILFIGMNSRDAGFIHSEYQTTREVVERFKAGQRDYGGRFHYRAAKVAALFTASQDRAPLDAERPSEDVVEALLASARIQAVQCAPGPVESRRSPTPAMWRNCPPLTVEAQLEVLRPTVVALLGNRTIAEVQEIPGLNVRWTVDWRRGGGCFARGRILVSGCASEIFGLYHPAYPGWTRSVNALVQSLKEVPVSGPPDHD